MVEKADGNTNETPKPSMLTRLFRLGRNSGTENSSPRIEKKDIGQPQLISSTSLLPDHQLSSARSNTVKTTNLTSNPDAITATSPDINKPLPPLPREMMAEAKAISPTSGPIINDQTAASRIPPRTDNPGRADVEAGAAEILTKIAQRPEIRDAPPIHRLGSRPSKLPEAGNDIAVKSEPKFSADRPAASAGKATQTLDERAVRDLAVAQRLKAAARRGVALPPVDRAIEIAQAAVSNRPPQIRDPSPANFETPPAVSSTKGNQRSGARNAKGIYKLVPSLAPIQEESSHVAGRVQPPSPVGRPAASAEDLGRKPGVEPARRSLFSFVAETSPNPVNRRLVPIKNTGTASVDNVVMNHPAASAEHLAGNSTKPSRDAPQPPVAKKNEPSALRGLDAHRNDSHSR